VWKTALVTLLCLGLLSACDESTPTATPGRPTSLVEELEWAPVVLADRCPPIHQKLQFPPGGQLPKGASVVRLCNGPAVGGRTSGSPQRYDVPEDMLTTNVGALIDQVNHLRPVPPPPASNHGRLYCPANGGIAINLWFGYPDGTAASIAWHPYGCQWLRLAPGLAAEGGRDVLASYANALAAQREGAHVLAHPPAPRCDPRAQPSSPLGYQALTHLAGVRICVLGRDEEPGVLVPGREVQRINREIGPRHAGGCVEPHGFLWLRATTTNGDHVDLYPDGCSFTLPVLPATQEPYPSWRPSKALARALERLVPDGIER
jgi:hypothetical protein